VSRAKGIESLRRLYATDVVSLDVEPPQVTVGGDVAFGYCFGRHPERQWSHRPPALADPGDLGTPLPARGVDHDAARQQAQAARSDKMTTTAGVGDYASGPARPGSASPHGTPPAPWLAVLAAIHPPRYGRAQCVM
jgi:hypothetical protein